MSLQTLQLLTEDLSSYEACQDVPCDVSVLKGQYRFVFENLR